MVICRQLLIFVNIRFFLDVKFMLLEVHHRLLYDIDVSSLLSRYFSDATAQSLHSLLHVCCALHSLAFGLLHATGLSYTVAGLNWA
jgi:hypothetical protein